MKQMAENAKSDTEMRREVDELKKKQKDPSSEHSTGTKTHPAMIKEKAIEEVQERVENFEEPRNVDKEAIQFFENEADKVWILRDEYHEW